MTLTNAAETATSSTTEGGVATQWRRWWPMGHRRWGMHEEIESLLEEGTFADFQEAVSGTPLAEKITTEEQFAQFKQMHALMQEWNVDEAAGIAETLWLPHFWGWRQWMRDEWVFQAYHEEIKTAIENNDFATFQSVLAWVENHPLSSIDTPEEFTTLVKIHSLRQEADALEEWLGIQKGHFGMRWPKGSHGDFREFEDPTETDDDLVKE